MLDGLLTTEVREHLQMKVDRLVESGFTIIAAYAMSPLARDRMIELTEQYRAQLDSDPWMMIIQELNEILFHQDGEMPASMLEQVFFNTMHHIAQYAERSAAA